MGGRVAPVQFPQPGAIGSAQQGSNAVLNPATTPQPATALSAFNPASFVPPTPAAPPNTNPLPPPRNVGNRPAPFAGRGGYSRGIGMNIDTM